MTEHVKHWVVVVRTMAMAPDGHASMMTTNVHLPDMRDVSRPPIVAASHLNSATQSHARRSGLDHESVCVEFFGLAWCDEPMDG